MAHRVRRLVEELEPGYFALVMATGIVAIACDFLGMTPLAWPLFGVGLASYCLLWPLTLARLAWFRSRMVTDFTDQLKGPGFLTASAASSILGMQLLIFAHQVGAATALWALGTVLWVLLTYAFLTVVIVRKVKPALDNGIGGEWLMIVVAAQSAVVLGGHLVSQLTPAWRQPVLLGALVVHLIGCMLYLLIIAPIFFRIIFSDLTPGELRPSYWINMGAEAVTTLAGATLILDASTWSFLNTLLPFLQGLALLFWASAAWWIPLLVILGAWRHIYRGFPLRYSPMYWSMVFPLGMYTACSVELGSALGLEPLMEFARYFVYVALLAWGATFAGLIASLARSSLEGDKKSAPEQ